jgi:copper chaperone
VRIAVENIKCGGCAASIRKGLLGMEGIAGVEVDIEAGVVEVHWHAPGTAPRMPGSGTAGTMAADTDKLDNPASGMVVQPALESPESPESPESLESAERRAQVVSCLQGMGYPETGSVQGLKAASAKARSFVSCAVGRLQT